MPADLFLSHPSRNIPVMHQVQPHDSTLWHKARAAEASFLAEMLTSAGAGRPMQSFGGGIGEDQFASLLVHAKAERIARRGGIGLAEMILSATLSNVAQNVDARK